MCRATGASAMPSRRKQQKPRHVDADESDDVQTRPPLDDDDDDDDAGKFTLPPPVCVLTAHHISLHFYASPMALTPRISNLTGLKLLLNK